MLNLDKNWIDLATMLQYSNDQIMIFFVCLFDWFNVGVVIYKAYDI